MTIYKFSRLTVPPTLEKRLEVLEAFRTLVSQDDELLQRRRAEIAAIRREAEHIRRCIDAFCRQLPELRAEILEEQKAQKYSPDQPRVPAGQSGGGQWTSEGGSSSSPDSMALPVAEEHPSSGRGPQYAALETNVVSDAGDGVPHSLTPQNSTEQRIHVAGNDWRNLSVNLAQEEAPNGPGHAISKHVAKTEAELRAQFPPDIRTWFVDVIKKREGSFDSIENANDLTNRTLRANSEKVDRVANGQEANDFIEYRFGFVTGYEVYRTDPNRPSYETRRTYGVGVFIVHDPRSPRGFRVITAFPKNFD